MAPTELAGNTSRSPHHFHIPVMGTGFTIDSPLRVARYGIDSCVSLLDDQLIESLRAYHSRIWQLPYHPIAASEEDARARRITAYLDLLHDIIEIQVASMRQSGFGEGSELDKYFQLLPECDLRTRYRYMLEYAPEADRQHLAAELAQCAAAGKIEVNIMTKCDREQYRNGEKLPPQFADAMSALRGFALSKVDGAVEFSAGLNQRLYQYAAQLPGFLPDELGHIRKRIILKVSDYRSALIQGRFLAKRGLWVSEFRVESGLNCGGHAFSSRGLLLACVLTEFKVCRHALSEELARLCNAALAEQGQPQLPGDIRLRLSVQGGVGTAAEHELLRRHWGTDSIGWGTPFLLVPEVTNVDPEHLEKLARARQRDVVLSDISPLGVPFWTLRNSASEENRRKLIREGRPGSSCPKGYARFCDEFEGPPLCKASRTYQARKLEELSKRCLPRRLRSIVQNTITVKACICHDLAGGVTRKLGIDSSATPCICCGPNIAYFRRVASLREMVEHIYGRANLLAGVRRPHMLYREVQLNIMLLKRQVFRAARGLLSARPQDLAHLRSELLEQLASYRVLLKDILLSRRSRYLRQINLAIAMVKRIQLRRILRETAR